MKKRYSVRRLKVGPGCLFRGGPLGHFWQVFTPGGDRVDGGAYVRKADALAHARRLNGPRRRGR